MSGWHIAQLNIAQMLAPAESPQLTEFFANLDRINALADQAPGFVWRLQDEEGSATSFRPFGADVLVNMSVWVDIESLHNYVYRSAHIEIMAKRKQWFEILRETYSVLWWIPADTLPTLHQAQQTLDLLKMKGPNPGAFTFYEPSHHPSAAGQETHGSPVMSMIVAQLADSSQNIFEI